MKIKHLLFALLAAVSISGCTREVHYTPTKGGLVDTLHNEIHVKDYEHLTNGEFNSDKDKEKEKDVTKIYITDDDGFKYIWDANEQAYILITETDTVINFFFDSNQTHSVINGVQVETPIYTMDWFMMKPMGQCPREIDTEAEVLEIGRMFGFEPRQGFNHFLGFSVYPSCVGDTEHMWDYKKDIRQQAVTNLYGVWVDD